MRSWQEQLCQQDSQPGEYSFNVEMAVEGNYNPQSSKELVGRGGQ